MKSLFPAALMRGVSVSALVITLAACTANPQPLDRPGDVPQTFTAPMDKTAPVWPMANWWTLYGTDELAPLQETAQRENLDIAMAGSAARDYNTRFRLAPTVLNDGRGPLPGLAAVASF